ncbi:hypothetical protein [Secundilactobacillus paracollinoides]|nr:hypothetical protein [Secundilactobacillus paracollinoides]
MNVIELKILTSHFDPALKIALDQDPLCRLRASHWIMTAFSLSVRPGMSL